MSGFEGVLASIPGYGGYLAKRRYDTEQGMGELQQAAGVAGLFGQLQAQQGAEAVRGILSKGGSPEEVIGALVKSGPAGAAAAHQYATALKDVASTKMMQGMGELDLKDPEKLLRASLMPGMAHLAPAADRAFKLKENQGALATLRDQPQPLPAGTQIPGWKGTPITDIPADEVSAFLKVANAGAQGQTASAAPAAGDPVLAGGGLFATLAKSEIPAIAAQARLQQENLNKAGASIPAAHWIDLQKSLAQQETTLLERRSSRPAEPLHAIIGPEGKPILAPRSQAVGATPANAQNVGPVVPPQHADLSGADYLATLPPGTANTVKGIADGSISLNAISQRNNQREAMIERVKQYDPTFSMQTYQARSAVQKDFTSGKAAQNVTSINTAIGHIGTLKEIGDALAQNNIPALNAVVNTVRTQLGKPEVNNYGIASDAIGHELMRVFRQVGATQHESEAWEAKFKAANSPAQRNEAIKVAVELLDSRIQALDDQWKRGMGTEKGFPNLLSPKSKAVLDKVGGKAESVQEFATEADAAKAGLKPGTKVKIGGVSGTWK